MVQQKRNVIKLVVIIISFLLIGKVVYQRIEVQAQEEAGLSISPVVFELNADPGDTLTNQVKIYNPTDFPQHVKMLVEDFEPVGEEGDVILDEPNTDNTYSLAKWTTISPKEFTLASEEQKLVTYAISIPPNGEPGGHYGSVVAFISGGSDQMTGSAVGSKRGALILLRVSGKISEDLTINMFSTKSFQEYGPIKFDLKFENIGNVHVRPAGFITIIDTWGKQVAQLDIPQNNVIPGAIRQAGPEWENVNLMGRYTATIVANYGSGSKETVTSVTTFTVFPWKKGLVIGGGVIIGLFLVIRGRRRLKRAFKVLLGK
jgi:hypothetical protein